MALSDVATPATTTTTPSVGTRFALGSSRGTVRYVGLVPPTQGVWLGVEWDDAQRGKHDGMHNGVRYFTCRMPNAGSFIRPSTKLAFGSSFLKALRVKYVDKEDEKNVAAANTSAHKYTRKNLADIEIEAPNMDIVRKRMAQLDRLRHVGLGGWKMESNPEAAPQTDVKMYAQVSRAFDTDEKPGDIRATCPNVRWLDLSRSLLPSWSEISRITSELPQLDTLLLHFNRFATLISEGHVENEAFASLTDLRLDSTLVSWPEICLLSTTMPKLEILQLGSNGLTQLLNADGSCSMFETLQTLNLDSNLLSDWAALMDALSICPNLSRLIVSNNHITRIPEPSSSHKASHIRHISLADNCLTEWRDLDNLSKWFDDLQGLVVSAEKCDFLRALDERDVRATIIARTPSLRLLNNAAIGEFERRDAELYYISMVKRSGKIAEHPRYEALCTKHGQLHSPTENPSDQASERKKSASTLRSKLLPVMVRVSTSEPSPKAPYTTPPSPPSSVAEQITMNLLITSPLRLLQSKIARSLQLPNGVRSIESIWALLRTEVDPAQDVAVQLRQELRPDGEAKARADERIVYELDNLDWDLAGYNFSQGDELVIVLVQE